MLFNKCLITSLLLLSCLTGCSKYVVPPGAANFDRLLSEEALAAGAIESSPDESRPSQRPSVTRAHFPAHVAVARIQESGYHSRTAHGFGGGDYSVVNVRDIERQEDFDRIIALDQLEQIVPMNRMLLPKRLVTEQPLREAAQRLHADMLLIYTLDTAFFDEDNVAPLTYISLGLSPTVEVRATTTLSALLLDANTGYLYAALESSKQEIQRASRLGSKETCDALRLKTERKAFEGFLDEFERAWPRVVAEYANQPPRANARIQGDIYSTLGLE